MEIQVLTVDQVRSALMVDDDFSTTELERLATLASSFIKQKTGYSFEKDAAIHPLAIELGQLYVKQLYYNGAGDYDRDHDYSIGISGLIIDLQDIASSKVAAKAVDVLIGKISNPVTLDDESAIVAARVAYDDLYPQDQEYVTLLSTLTSAESSLEALR